VEKVKCGLSEQAMATRQNTRATVFHAIEIRIIPVHIFTDKQRIQAHCLMYRYAPTLGPSSLYITTATNTRSMEKEENQTTN
jgi:hypothetical protein